MSAESGVPGLMAAMAAGRTVLAPNTELAAALFDAVERDHRTSGVDVWSTPRVLDYGSWMRERYAQRQLCDATTPRILSEIEERELWRSVIESSERGHAFLEPAGAARAARRARRTMHEYGIPFGAVQAAAAGSDEVLAFLEWNRDFDRRCRELDCLSTDALPPVAAPSESLAWIDSPAWRPMARQWLTRHGTMLPPPGAPAPALTQVHAASLADELAAMAQWARTNLLAHPGFRAWMLVPDLRQRRAEVVDAMDAVLAPQRFTPGMNDITAPYAVAGGTPLADYGPVHVALELLAVSSGTVSFERFSALLRAPELQATAGELGAASLLDLRLRKEGPAEADFATWLALSGRIAGAPQAKPVAALQRLRAAAEPLAEKRGEHPFSGWVPAWTRALELGPWALRHRWSSREFQAAERFRELLSGLAAADAFFARRSGRSALGILMRAARETAFQAQTGVPPIWISGQVTDPWLSYGGLWVSGFSSERWPPAVEPVPLLPIHLQREYGIMSAAAQSQLHFALELQDRWKSRGQECVFSHADAGDGRVSRASPLLPQCAQPLVAAVAPAQPHWRAQLAAAPLLLRVSDERGPRFAPPEHTRGVATLTAQSRCAFRGFAHTRLRAGPLERPVPGFSERERGELIHHALEHVWSALRDSNTLRAIAPSALNELLAHAIERALSHACRMRDPGPRWCERERRRMDKLLRKWLDVESRRAPFEVEYVEQGAQSARHAGLEFTVRIDRVDRLADGARIVIDYKTGNPTADWRGERPDNAQLPMYALARPDGLVGVAYGKVNARDCGFVAEVERRDVFKPGGRPSALEGRPTLAALIAVWSMRMDALAAQFAAGDAAVAPTAKACRSCSFHGLCRVPSALDETGDLSE